MKTTYYLSISGTVLRGTTAIAREKLARCAAKGLWCKAINPKTAKNMIKNGVQFIKIQDLY